MTGISLKGENKRGPVPSERTVRSKILEMRTFRTYILEHKGPAPAILL